MAKYEITIEEELESKLKIVSDAANVPIEDIIQGFIDDKLLEAQTDLIVRQYKEGNLTATKAWKLSGLSFDEFMALAKE